MKNVIYLTDGYIFLHSGDCKAVYKNGKYQGSIIANGIYYHPNGRALVDIIRMNSSDVCYARTKAQQWLHVEEPKFIKGYISAKNVKKIIKKCNLSVYKRNKWYESGGLWDNPQNHHRWTN